MGCQASLGPRQPIGFAAQWASLDVLSGGRTTLVACTGPPRDAAAEAELDAFGITHRTRVERMEEVVTLLPCHDGESEDSESGVSPGQSGRPRQESNLRHTV